VKKARVPFTLPLQEKVITSFVTWQRSYNSPAMDD
jgi:hypothetical protein